MTNAILFITNAEYHRKQDHLSGHIIIGTFNRLHPILMTSLAMIAGMISMSLCLGESGDQRAPLDVVVIGGLIFSTISTLIFLPIVYAQVMGKKPYKKPFA